MLLHGEEYRYSCRSFAVVRPVKLMGFQSASYALERPGYRVGTEIGIVED
jgi:hypothetical protein